ncbi:pyocin knob domain-containing protein [Microaceticoccus formicicus]|uniref:pyocin knob domain-containing protein n=1 Tax=Microaceticoccus formicicus TaxID=3118105 RepID=UPI003CD043CE|nr:hypothetical protein VZL98_05025 [Peptoniphilaceae bacterium AMB_02]
MSLSHVGIKDITINFDEHELEDLVIVQGDTGTRGFRVTLTNNMGEIIPASTSYELRLIGVNSNYPDKSYYTVAEIEDDKYLARISSDMASAKGILSIQLALYEGSTRLIHTRIWDLQVNKALSQGGEVGKDLVVDFTLLSEAIARTEMLEGEYNASLAQQEVIKSDIDTKHGEVTTMHTELQTTLDKELERQSAETARATAEEARDTAETARKEAETDRQGKEAARQSTEAGRVSAENTRLTNEDARIDAENARIDAENARNTAENLRATEETKRRNNEVSRQDAEVIREQNEETRVTTQSQRDSIWQSWQGLIEEQTLPPATDMVAGVLKIDKAGQDTATSTDTFNALKNLVQNGQIPKNAIKFNLNEDLNNYIEVGFYYTDISVVANSLANKPTDIAFGMTVLKTAGIVQIAYEYSQNPEKRNKMFIRAYYNHSNKWNDWWEVASLQEVQNLLNNKVDKASGMGLSQNSYTTVEKQKLSGIASSANNYTHPASHDASIITESTTRRFVSDTEKNTWNAKIGSHGSIVIERIAVIQAGESTAEIPNNTLILELEVE